jgi:hypothetical protein
MLLGDVLLCPPGVGAWTHLVSECRVNNKYSTANFTKAGFIQREPEQPWERDSVYWVKAL